MRRAYRIRRGFIVYFSIVGVLLLLAVFAKVQLLSLIGSFTAVLSTAFVASSAQKQGVTALAKSSDIRAVPFLLEALEFNQKDLQSQSRNTLITLLPQLRLEHTNMLTAAHRKILHKHLKKNDIPFQIAILKGLEQIGDETSLEVVQEIAR